MLLCLVAFAQAPTVSLSLPATMLQTVAKHLSAKTGTPITVDRMLWEVPVIVSVKNVPQEELLQKLAHVVGAEAALIDGAYRISRTGKIATELREHERANLEAQWTSMLEFRRKILEKNPWTTTHAQKVLDLERRKSRERSITLSVRTRQFNPSARLIFRLLQSIGPKRLAEVLPVGMAVYSRYPTAVQRRFPKSIEPILAQYAEELKLSPPALQQQQDQRGQAGPLGKLLLRIDNSHMMPSAHVSVFTSSGEPADFASVSHYEPVNLPVPAPRIKFDSLQGFKASPTARAIKPFSREDDDEEEDMDPSSLLTMPDKVAEEPSAELREIFINPELVDPLAFLPSEAMLSYATQKGLNLVACLASDTQDYSLVDQEGKVELRKMLEGFAEEADWTEANGWAVVRPRFILESEETRVGRSALGKLLRTVYKNGSSLLAEAEYSASLPRRLLPMLGDYFPAVTYLENRQGSSITSSHGSAYLSRFLGLLSDTQGQRLSGSGVLVAADLLPNQIAALADAAYGYGRVDFPENISFPRYMTEATEALPNGVPRTTRVLLTSQFDRVWLYRRWGRTETVTPLQVAALRVLKTKPLEGEFLPLKGFIESWSFEELFAGTLETHNVVFDFGNKVERSATFTYRNIRQSKSVKVDSIPELKAEVARRQKELAGKTVEEIFEIALSGGEG